MTLSGPVYLEPEVRKTTGTPVSCHLLFRQSANLNQINVSLAEPGLDSQKHKLEPGHLLLLR